MFCQEPVRLSRVALGSAKAIAHPAQRFDKIAMLAEFAPYRCYLQVYRTFRHLGVFTAYGIDNLIACKHPPWASRQKVQNVELGWGQVHHLVSHTHFIAARMDHDIVIDHGSLGICLTLLAPPHGFDAGEEDRGLKVW